MSVSITSGASTITPLDIIGYRARTEANSVVKTLLSGAVAVTARPDSPRSGDLVLLFATAATAWAAHALLTTVKVWTLTTTAPEPTQPSMKFVRARSEMTIELDPETRVVWLLTVPYQEVLP